MKLNKQDKEEVRAKIVEQLQNVPDGQRVHLDKELLEELLFETIICKKETGETVKLPIWSGEFLRKIDLSEISFDNVAWSLLTESTRDIDYDEVFDEETLDKFYDTNLYALPDGQMVDYSYTNAKIDFSKSWEAKRGNFNIICCNFSGVDLSNNDMSQLGCSYNSNLSNTGIILSPDMFDSPIRERFGAVDLSENDLSKFTINAIDLVVGVKSIFDDECNFSNTGINIIIDPDDINNLNMGDHVDRGYFRRYFKAMLDNGFLVGCYVNGKKIEESQAIKSQKLSEYQDYKQSILDSVSSSIDEQVSHMKK